MNTGHDFFTLIHKGQRKELFAATVVAGTTNWEDPSAASNFVSLWSKLASMLEAHAAHEHNHVFPLLAQHAPETVEHVEAAHDDLEHRLVTLTDTIARAAGQRTQGHGLAVYRELTAFVAHYLLHILDEETLVMPEIWRLCTDAEINAARLDLQADQTPAGVTRSRRAILPAITEAERTSMAHAVQRGSTTEAFSAFMSDARQVLEAPAWQRLGRSLAEPHSCSDHTPSTSKQGS
jgi:iron-sulfur cluster repair protein YtfE (RIC family)